MNKTVVVGKLLEMTEDRLVVLQSSGIDVFNRKYYCLLEEMFLEDHEEPVEAVSSES